MDTTFNDETMSPGALVSVAGAASRDKQALPLEAHHMLRALERALGQSFTVVDCHRGQRICGASGELPFDPYTRLAACQEIARRGRPEIVDEVSPLSLLCVPLTTSSPDSGLVGLSMFVTEHVTEEAQVVAAAQEFGFNASDTLRWCQTQQVWPVRALLEVCSALAEKFAMQQNNLQLKRQLSDISSHLLMTFEEITLLHRLTEHLSIAKSVTDLCELSAKWLADVIPAKSIAIWFESLGTLDEGHRRGQSTGDAMLITQGNCPLADCEFKTLFDRLGPRVATEPLVLNRGATSSPTWFYPDVKEIISVPIREGNRSFGWILAMNHTGAGDVTNSEAEFGTVEACLMASVATILGIHCGNIALYHEQSEFFSSVVRALTSAIDAKDPYTCGHSDRVARLSVCLARQMDCNSDDLNTIYLSGLLHDIGKIGIDDQVLRKPGALTPDELEHIKTHPELGCRILDGVKQLDKVLPVVRHHHEAWNGKGYPDGLKEEETPLLARIVAVADSIDAMSSDRPYRKGMDDEKLDAILRDGAGKQWDARVIDAAFKVRNDLRRIGRSERKPLSLDVERWQQDSSMLPSPLMRSNG